MQRLKIKNPEEIKKQIYNYLNSSKEAKFIHRLHALLLMIDNAKNNCENVANLFHNSPRTVSNWVHKINENINIDILKDKNKPGRKPMLSKKQEDFIKESLLKHPSEFGLNANIWSGKVLSHFIKVQFGVDLKIRQCQRLFHKLNFALKRARPMLVKGDEKKKEAFKKN